MSEQKQRRSLKRRFVDCEERFRDGVRLQGRMVHNRQMAEGALCLLRYSDLKPGERKRLKRTAESYSLRFETTRCRLSMSSPATRLGSRVAAVRGLFPLKR